MPGAGLRQQNGARPSSATTFSHGLDPSRTSSRRRLLADSGLTASGHGRTGQQGPGRALTGPSTAGRRWPKKRERRLSDLNDGKLPLSNSARRYPLHKNIFGRCLRCLEINSNHGAEWKALISTYIGTIPPKGEAPCADEQRMSAGPPPCAAVRSAMRAKLGVATKPIQRRRRARLPPPLWWSVWHARSAIAVSLMPWSLSSGRRPLRRRTPRPISGRARPRRNCRANSTTCRSGSGDSLRASPPRPPGARAL